MAFMKRRDRPRIPETDASSVSSHIRVVAEDAVAESSIAADVVAEDTDPPLVGDLQVPDTEVFEQADRQTVPQNRGGEPGMFLRYGIEGT